MTICRASLPRPTSLVTGKVEHTHIWRRYRQTVRPDNQTFNGSAYFIVKACDICHDKKTIDYIVEFV